MSESIVPEIRALQRIAGAGNCAFCCRVLRRTGKRHAHVCWSVDCRNEENAARHRWRATQRREALAALTRAVAAVGWSTRVITEAIGTP